MPIFADSHCHFYADKFKDDRDDVMQKCIEEGVERIYMPNIDHESIEEMLEVEEKYKKNCFSMMGLHPCSVNRHFEKDLYEVETWLDKRSFVAVGEIGIDLYWDKQFVEQQMEALRIQIEMAKKHDLPIVLHCRESFEETIALIEEMNDGNLRGVFHCFTGSVKDAERVVAQGFYIGLGGVVTFKNGGLDQVVPDLDLENILLETDSPYLAPVPFRGKRNQPVYIPLIARKIAELSGKTVEEVAQITSANTLKLFHG